MTGRIPRARFVWATLVLVAACATAWCVVPLDLRGTVETTERLIRSWGAWGVLCSIGLMVSHSFLPFPAEIVALANGMLYGPLWGAVITWVGAMLGAAAAFAVARFLGRPVLARMLSVRQQAAMANWSRTRGGWALLGGRLVPFIAFNMINYAAGLAGIGWWTFLWATGLGILPLTILLAVLGESALDTPGWIWALLGALWALGWIESRYSRSLSKGA